jgi:hypothetical protein
MFVDDRQEYIGTSGRRLNSEPCGYTLKARRGVGRVRVIKPCRICSRVSHVNANILDLLDVHNSRSTRYTVC